MKTECIYCKGETNPNTLICENTRLEKVYIYQQCRSNLMFLWPYIVN